MKPYFQDKFTTIYNGDCKDVLQQLDINVNAVITDPPYGINYNSGHYKYGNPFSEIIGDNKYPTEMLELFEIIADKAIILFANWETLRKIKLPTSVIIWAKNNWTAGDLNHEYARQYEIILFYALRNHKFTNGRPQDIIHCNRIVPTVHPTEKPVELISKLILQNTEQEDIILDPYLGSGTTAVAAKNTLRNCIGIEIEERYCEVTAKRLSQNVMELNI